MALDFLSLKLVVNNRRSVIEPEFKINIVVNDLMIKGGTFYAIYDEDTGFWVTNRNASVNIIDREIDRLIEGDEKLKSAVAEGVNVLYLKWTSNGSFDRFLKFCERQCCDNYKKLNQTILFDNDKVSRGCYATFKLPYAIGVNDDCPSWNRFMDTLYGDDRVKIEWCLGLVISGDFKVLHKFLAIEGSPGSGKSTILHIIEDMFNGYCTTFSAKALTSAADRFALSPFAEFPIIGFDHDADLSRIDTNSRLNALVSHDKLTVDEKNKKLYSDKFNVFLFIGTNESIQMTNAKTGLSRRAIVARPTNNLIEASEYRELLERVKFEYPAIARKCLDYYNKNKKKFIDYFDTESFINTNHIYDFFSEMYFEYSKNTDKIWLNRLWNDYQRYLEETKYQYGFNRQKFAKEAREYFYIFKDSAKINGKTYRNVYQGFKANKFIAENDLEKNALPRDIPEWLKLTSADPENNQFNMLYSDCMMQGCKVVNDSEIPKTGWDNVFEKVKNCLNETVLTHYVLLGGNNIVIDFDLKDENGEKSLEENLKAAAKFPKTYAEVSKSGKGLHLHYIYDGDVSRLSRLYDDGIEVKVFTGKSSLRRRLSLCNDEEIATISSGLPLKEDTKVIDGNVVLNEKAIRTIIKRNIFKEYHADTSSSINYIYKTLEDAYNNDVNYDVSDMKNDVTMFAAQSSNQSARCLKLVGNMHFKGKKYENEDIGASEYGGIMMNEVGTTAGFGDELDYHGRDGFDLDKLKEREKNFVFFDTEVFPNLFVLVWKRAGNENHPVTWINPTGAMVEDLVRNNDLIGFNNRNYDNHILYARILGYNEADLYELSQKIINAPKGAKQNYKFSEAYRLAFTDIYDFASASNKKSLKKFEIELGISHVELGLPWDESVPEDMWQKVADYCINDVVSTEVVFNHLYSDYTTRVILADISGGNIYDSTNTLSTRLIFQGNRNPQGEFCYRDLSKPVGVGELSDSVKGFLSEHAKSMMNEPFDSESILPYFKGYKFEGGKSEYKGVDPGEGGYVYHEPGIYWNVALIDVASMHPHSAIAECLFGPRYTEVFHELVLARIYIKHKDYEKLSSVLGGRLSRYAKLVESGVIKGKDLSTALKTVINSVYGLTSAKFKNPFRDDRNIDNIVAKRGALMMIDLKEAVEAKGYKVAHIKTDSIKVANADPEIVKFVQDFGRRYGYEFEFEAVYERMALVNKACYICRFASTDFCQEKYGFIPDENEEYSLQWSATAAQFAEPYVFKTLFSHEEITFKDMMQTKSVQTRMELDCNEGMGEGEHNYRFVGKEGSYVPVIDGVGGGYLYRISYKEVVDENGKVEKVPKYDSVSGTKGYKWLESEVALKKGGMDIVDRGYYRTLVDDAVKVISEFGDFDEFVSV